MGFEQNLCANCQMTEVEHQQYLMAWDCCSKMIPKGDDIFIQIHRKKKKKLILNNQSFTSCQLAFMCTTSTTNSCWELSRHVTSINTSHLWRNVSKSDKQAC